MRIVVINLARSKDRRQLMESNLSRLGLAFEFFNGIDASRGEHVRLSRYNDLEAWRYNRRPLSTGEIGCFASHYLLWQRCLHLREPLVIMEDDTVVEEGLVRALAALPRVIARLPLIRLGLSMEGPHSTQVLPLTPELELVALASALGTQCYALSESGAKALINSAAVWTQPVDIYLNAGYMHGLRSYGLRPYFVKHADQNVYPSIIGDTRYSPPPDNPLLKIISQVKTFVADRQANSRTVQASGR